MSAEETRTAIRSLCKSGSAHHLSEAVQIGKGTTDPPDHPRHRSPGGMSQPVQLLQGAAPLSKGPAR